MRFYRFAILIFYSASLLAVSDRDLPKLPAPVEKYVLGNTPPQKNSQNQQDEFTLPKEKPWRDNAGIDLNQLPIQTEEGYEEELEAPPESPFGTESDLNEPVEIEESNEPSGQNKSSSLAPGLKSHKTAPNISYPSLPTPPPIQLVGVALFGDRNAVDRENLTGFQGCKIVNLELPGDPYILQARLRPAYFGQPFNQATLDRITKIIQDYYRQYGDTLVEVYIPRQDITTQVLSLLVLKVKIGKIDIYGNRWTTDSQLVDRIDLHPGQAIDVQKTEGNINFLNRNPFRHVEASYSLEPTNGIVDAEVYVNELFPFRVYGGMDNMGLSLIGTTREFIGANWANLSGLDQIMSFQFTGSLDFKKYLSYTGDYIIYLPWNDIVDFFGGYSQVHPSSNNPAANHKGTFYQVSGRYIFPIGGSKNFTQEVRIGMDFKRMNNNLEFIQDFPIFSPPVDLSQLVLTYRALYERKAIKLEFLLSGYYSPGEIFSKQSTADYQLLRAGAENHYVYGKATFNMNIYMPWKMEMKVKAVGQLSSTNLLPSEEIGIGGLDLVRGYQERTANGDNGYYGQFEFGGPGITIIQPRKTPRGHVISDRLWAAGFIDCGYVAAKFFIPAFSVPQPKSVFILGAGPGLRYQIDRYLMAQLDVGFKLRHTDFPGGNPMIQFLATASF